LGLTFRYLDFHNTWRLTTDSQERDRLISNKTPKVQEALPSAARTSSGGELPPSGQTYPLVRSFFRSQSQSSTSASIRPWSKTPARPRMSTASVFRPRTPSPVSSRPISRVSSSETLVATPISTSGGTLRHTCQQTDCYYCKEEETKRRHACGLKHLCPTYCSQCTVEDLAAQEAAHNRGGPCQVNCYYCEKEETKKRHACGLKHLCPTYCSQCTLEDLAAQKAAHS
jgi:hypothetical protein